METIQMIISAVDLENIDYIRLVVIIIRFGISNEEERASGKE